MSDFNLHNSLPVSRSAHDTVPRHFGPPGAVDYRTLPGSNQARSDDPLLVFTGMTERQPRTISDVKLLKGTSYSYKNRQIISRWIRDVCAAFKLRTSTFNLSVQLCDIFMVRNLQTVAVNKCQCVALASIWLSAKFEELDQHVPPAQQLSDVCDRSYPPSEIIDMEERVLGSLKWRLPHTTATNFLYFYLHVLTHNAGFQIQQQVQQQEKQQSGKKPTVQQLKKIWLLKPGTQPATSTSTPPPSAGPQRSCEPLQWVDVTSLVQNAQQMNLTEAAFIEKLSIAQGHTPSQYNKDPNSAANANNNRVVHTTVLQLMGKAVVLAYKLRAGSLLQQQAGSSGTSAVTSSSSSGGGGGSSSSSNNNNEGAIDWMDDGSGEIRLFLRIDKQDGTFSECRGVSLLRGPNSDLLVYADALTREAFLHVEFLPCTAHEMGLAILSVAIAAVSSDIAEISLQIGMLLRRLRIEATNKSNFVMATALLAEKAMASGVVAPPPNSNNNNKEGFEKMIKSRISSIMDSCCALSCSSGSPAETLAATYKKSVSAASSAPQQQQVKISNEETAVL